MTDAKKLNLLIAFGLIALGVSLRVIPHPANFAPVAAIAIFGGAVLPRKYALWVPLLAMMISDMVIGLHSLIAVTWGTYLLIALASSYIMRRPTVARGAALTFSSSLLFFFTTNFAVWLTSGMYLHTWAGLQRCFTLALPFFRNTALSDLIYTGALFGIYAIACNLGKRALDYRAAGKLTG